MVPVKLTISTIEHIVKLASLRDANPLAPDENVELFDSMDCLDIDELSELYAIVVVGSLDNAQEFLGAKEEARTRGYHSLDLLWNNESLGSSLARGCELLGFKTI